MNRQNKFLLPDKSFWKALDHEQQKALSSKYTILFPPILFTEIAKNGLSPCNPSLADLELENLIVIPHWSEHVKMDLLTEEVDKPIHFESASTMKSILESPEQERLAFVKASGEYIEMLEENEVYLKSLESIINPLKEGLLRLVNNTDNLSEGEWMNYLKKVVRANHTYYPEIERILKRMETEGFLPEGKKRLQASLKILYETYNAETLENANQLAARLLDHDPSDRSAAYDKLQRLCTFFCSILTQEERNQIFDRFLKESMPPINRFAPYALGVAIWNFTIKFYLRENPENAAPRNVLRDAAYLFYTSSKAVNFVSGDKWHRKFVNEVPLFEGVRENFLFVDLTTKATIQAEFSKFL